MGVSNDEVYTGPMVFVPEINNAATRNKLAKENPLVIQLTVDKALMVPPGQWTYFKAGTVFLFAGPAYTGSDFWAVPVGGDQFSPKNEHYIFIPKTICTVLVDYDHSA